MALIELIEICVLCVAIYYLYYLISNYSTIKRKKKFYEKYKNQYLLSLLGAIGIIISFQVFWFTDYYEKHTSIEILIKIILGIFSIINQILITDIEKEKKKSKKKKDDDFNIFSESSNKHTGFKLINRLYLLNVVFKILYRKV